MEWKEEWGKGEREGEKLGILSSLGKRKKGGGEGKLNGRKERGGEKGNFQMRLTVTQMYI